MRTLIKIGSYSAILFEDGPEGFLAGLAKAKLVQVSGYGSNRVFKPSEETIEIELLPDTLDDTPVLNALHKAETEANSERSRRYTAESKLKKLQERFGVEEEK